MPGLWRMFQPAVPKRAWRTWPKAIDLFLLDLAGKAGGAAGSGGCAALRVAGISAGRVPRRKLVVVFRECQ